MTKPILYLIATTILFFIDGYLLSYLPSSPLENWWAIPLMCTVILWTICMMVAMLDDLDKEDKHD